MANLQETSVGDEPPETLLQMDYWSEELNETQSAYYSKAEREYAEIMTKVQDFIRKGKGEVLERGSEIMVLQAPAGSPAVSMLSNLVTPVSQAIATAAKGRLVPIGSQPQQQMPSLQPVPSQQLLIQGGPVPSGGRVARSSPVQTTPTFQPSTGAFQTPQGTIQLVMDPRLGYFVGAIQNQQCAGGQTIQAPSPAPPAPTLCPIQPAQPSAPPLVRQNTPLPPRSIIKTPVTTAIPPQTKASVQTPTTTVAATSTLSNTVNTYKAKPRSSPSVLPTASTAPPTTIPPSVNRPTENNSVGGLSAGCVINRKKETEETTVNATGPDSREVSFNKLSGKTFPSLVVLARPNLRIKDLSQTKINQERSALDSKVKCVLMYSASKFCEWLIQQGLLRSDQFCSSHSTSERPAKLKLGMYSDASKFPFSGGYVWISDCCPQRFVSVFSGSIFEGAPHSPAVLLKLMYHWCCQTNVQNVVQWVKVDNSYVKNFFTHMRSMCVAAVHEKHEKLGGPQKRVEVGVISLGTTSQDGNMRQVKVEVLGVMDPESRLVRLRAVEPLQEGERNYKRRFVKILEPLEQWVHKESIILTDFTVDKGTLLGMGFNQVHQSTIPDPPTSASKLSNQNIMEYLRRIVPRMFQNTLSLLSRQIIQQFLDELVWRERWGPVPSQAFDSLISHLAAQTRLDSGESLIAKLAKIAANPFRKWDYDNWKNNGLIPIHTFALTVSQSIPDLTVLSSSSNRSNAEVSEQQCDMLDKVNDAPNRYYPIIVQARTYEPKLDEDAESRLKVALLRIERGLSLRLAVETFKLPLSFLLYKAKDILKTKAAAGQNVFTDDEEEDIKEHLLTLGAWGYPFGRWDIRLVVKQYLDTCRRTEHRFKDNFPSDVWIEKFLTRHPSVREKLCRNIPSRGTFVEFDLVKQYLSNLTSVESIPPSNILNFVEIGLTGDPLRSMTVELRDLRYPVGKRRVKSSAAVMLACTASGQLLSSYVIFEGKPVVVSKGPTQGEYHATKTGWFDENTFQQWLESVVLPWAAELEGRKVVIGDSLAQLFTFKTLALCKDNNISFLSMPCNISGVLSPLDVVLCDKLRVLWRSQTRAWASSHGDKFIMPEDFPCHIHELIGAAISEDLSGQLRTAFRVIGLYPFNSSNTMQALENGGVFLNGKQENQVDKSQPSKRKRIYIGTDESSVKKKPAVETPEIEEVVLDEKETQSDIAVLEESLKNCNELVSLEGIYYGTRKPDADIVKNEYKMENLNIKCPMCHKSSLNNLELMKHLLGHSEKHPSVAELEHIHQCRYCVQNFDDSAHVELHISETHKNLGSRIVCLICSKKYQSRQSLIVHMMKTHTMLELPYCCSICNFRSSEHFKVVDHFYEVHANGEKILCPFCLKCVAISNWGKKIPANIFFFMHHVRKHLVKNSARKCDKCALWFVHKGILKEHQANDHMSCKGDPRVEPYSVVGVMMPLPSDFKESIVGKIENGNGFIHHKKETFILKGLEPSLCCLECSFNLVQENHFVGYMSCVHCVFATCCSVAMERHVEVFHGKGRPQSSSILPVLTDDMHCICGYHSKNGNMLADHLVSCKGNSVYSSAASANAAMVASRQSASFPPLVSLEESTGDDPSEQWIKAFSSKKGNDDSSKGNSSQNRPPSMLNLLGLVRKQSVEENSEHLASPADTEDESSKDRPSSRASSTSSTSRKRRREANETVLVLDGKEGKTCSNENVVKKASVAKDDKQESHAIVVSSKLASVSETNHQAGNENQEESDGSHVAVGLVKDSQETRTDEDKEARSSNEECVKQELDIERLSSLAVSEVKKVIASENATPVFSQNGSDI